MKDLESELVEDVLKICPIGQILRTVKRSSVEDGNWKQLRILQLSWDRFSCFCVILHLWNSF